MQLDSNSSSLEENPMRSSIAFLALIAILSLSSAPRAEGTKGMKVSPGKWEIKMTSHMPMMPQPIVNVGTQCIKESEMKPDEFLRESGECNFSNVVADGSEFSWSMICHTDGGDLTGTGAFISRESEMSGVVIMEMQADGQVMMMKNTWEGKRIGACD